MAAVRVTVTCDWCEDTETFDTIEDWYASQTWWSVDPPMPESNEDDDFTLVEDLTFCSRRCMLLKLSDPDDA